jgi:hypothetical protein
MTAVIFCARTFAKKSLKNSLYINIYIYIYSDIIYTFFHHPSSSPKYDTVICHNCHLLARAWQAYLLICKHISQYKDYRWRFLILLITNQLQRNNFGLRRPWLSPVQTPTFPWGNSHFTLSKLRVFFRIFNIVNLFLTSQRVWPLVSIHDLGQRLSSIILI